jgi:hypothetical protein
MIELINLENKSCIKNKNNEIRKSSEHFGK